MLIRGLGLLLVLLPLQDPPARTLLDRLKGDSAADRSLAFEGLRALGRSAEPELRKAADDPDPEVAARSRALLGILELRESISPALRVAFPGLEDRLALHPWEWTATLFEAVRCTDEDKLFHPELAWEDLDALATGALQRERDPDDVEKICCIAGERRLRGCLPHLHRLLDHPSERVRRAAVGALVQLRSPQSIAPVARLLEDPAHWEDAEVALMRFGRTGADPFLASQARHPDPAARRYLATVLGRWSPAGAEELLVSLGRDSDPGVRAEALLNLVGVQTGRIPDGAVELLEHPSERTQAHAYGALRRSRSPDRVRRIRSLLDSPDSDTRRRCVALLGDYQEKESIPDLMARLEDADSQVRGAAAYALLRLREPEAIPALTRLLIDPCDEVRLSAARTLAAWGDRGAAEFLMARLREGCEEERFDALRAAVDCDAALVAPDVARLARSEACAELRLRAIHTLAALNAKDCAQDLIPLLESAEDNIAECAESALKSLASPLTIPSLLKILSHQDSGVRGRALAVLDRLEARELDARLPALLEDPDPHVQLEALRAVRSAPDRLLIPRIRAFLKDPNPDLRRAAAVTLAQCGAPEALDDLLPLLKEDAEHDLPVLIHLLPNIGGRRAVQALSTLLDCSYPRCRSAALDGILNLGGLDAATVLRRVMRTPGHPLREEAVSGLAAVDPVNASPYLLACLRDPSLPVQDAAARALAALRCREAIPVLLDLFRKDVGGTRTSLIEALGRLKAAEAGPGVLRLLGHEDVQVVQAAIAATEDLELSEAAPRLLALARGDDLWVRHAAAAALARLGRSDEVPSLVQGDPRDLFLLNRLRRPDLWDRLRRSAPLEVGPQCLLGYWRELACGMGMEVTLEHSNPSYEGSWFSCPEVLNLPDSLLEQVLHSLADEDFTLVLEEDRLRVLRVPAAQAFWKTWWRAEQAR